MSEKKPVSTHHDLLVLPGEGVRSETHLVTKIHASRLGDDFSVMEGVMEPRSLLTPHTHDKEDQVVIVLNGELVFEVGGAGGDRFIAPAGSYVLKPRGVQHTFWNATDEAVRYIELSGGAGFQGFVDSSNEHGAVVASLRSTVDYSMRWHYERVPALMLENGLRRIAGVELPWDQLQEGTAGDVAQRIQEALLGPVG